MKTTYRVIWSKQVEKQLDRIPFYIRDKLLAWVMVIERVGIAEMRKLTGYHDEPLSGERKGQRSIRLNRSYRAIYIERENGNMHIVEIIKVTKHGY